MLLRNGKQTEYKLADKLGDTLEDKVMFLLLISVFLIVLHLCIATLVMLILNVILS